MGRIELITGGARSGKSRFAEERARRLLASLRGGDTTAATGQPDARVTYIATAVPFDDEMVDRIAHHRARRPEGWRTVEAPDTLGPAIEQACREGGVVLVDCLAVWVSNRLFGLGEPPEAPGADAAPWWEAVNRLESELVSELAAACDAARAGAADLLLVTNEVGLGLVPPTPIGRAYRDLLGRCSQLAAARADAVYLTVAGLAIDLARFAAP
jgi:adenosylcobinamide kinase/adenosylcobinamide-phosphate guanylyltransferase